MSLFRGEIPHFETIYHLIFISDFKETLYLISILFEVEYSWLSVLTPYFRK